MAFGIDDIIGAGLSIINKFIPDANAQAEAAASFKAAVLQAQAAQAQEQADVDKTEAANGSVFVAGWRPAVGWLCVGTLAYSWVLAPLITWIAVAHHSPAPPLPTLSSEDSQTLLYALLGIGGLRSVDKYTGHSTMSIAKGK